MILLIFILAVLRTGDLCRKTWAYLGSQIWVFKTMAPGSACPVTKGVMTVSHRKRVSERAQRVSTEDIHTSCNQSSSLSCNQPSPMRPDSLPSYTTRSLLKGIHLVLLVATSQSTCLLDVLTASQHCHTGSRIST